MIFNTPKFDAAVAAFKALCPGHSQLYEYGQFYVTERTHEDLNNSVVSQLRANPVFMANPQAQSKIDLLGAALNASVNAIGIPQIMTILNGVEHNGDMAGIRALFAISPNDSANAQKDFSAIWSTPDIPPAPLFSSSEPTLGKARAAFKLEKDRCFEMVGAFARKLLKKRGIANLPRALFISDGVVAGSHVVELSAETPALRALQIIVTRTPAQLASSVVRMKAAIDAGGYVHCGVLSGAADENSRFPNPEHHILAFAHDIVAGQDAFLFWDPDAAHSRIVSTTWGRGFGVLFFNGVRLSTAFDDPDLNAVERIKGSRADGDHQSDLSRHRYQVYSLQTLPLPATLKMHTKLLGTSADEGYERMLHNAITVFAAQGIELIEASRETLAPEDDAGNLRTVFIGDGGEREPSADLITLHDAMRSRGPRFGVTPSASEIVVAVVDKLVPASRGCANHRPGQPGIVLSAALANEWTLAHQIGRVLGLELAADPGQLMFASTAAFGDHMPSLTDEEVATIMASDLAEG